MIHDKTSHVATLVLMASAAVPALSAPLAYVFAPLSLTIPANLTQISGLDRQPELVPTRAPAQDP
jgi:hypothetical protein